MRRTWYNVQRKSGVPLSANRKDIDSFPTRRVYSRCIPFCPNHGIKDFLIGSAQTPSVTMVACLNRFGNELNDCLFPRDPVQITALSPFVFPHKLLQSQKLLDVSRANIILVCIRSSVRVSDASFSRRLDVAVLVFLTLRLRTNTGLTL